MSVMTVTKVDVYIGSCPSCGEGRLFYETATPGEFFPLESLIIRSANYHERKEAQVEDDTIPAPTTVGAHYIEWDTPQFTENDKQGKWLRVGMPGTQKEVQTRLVESNTTTRINIKGRMNRQLADGTMIDPNDVTVEVQDEKGVAGVDKVKTNLWNSGNFICSCGEAYTVSK